MYNGFRDTRYESIRTVTGLRQNTIDMDNFMHYRSMKGKLWINIFQRLIDLINGIQSVKCN